MKFNELDARMRLYETALDQLIPPQTYVVARLDGRGFTRLTKEVLDLEKPFSPQFRDAMIRTVEHLMNCGFNVWYGYCQSDEISLLFPRDEQGFSRKLRKWLSVLFGEASAAFTLAMGHAGTFDCRLSLLPTEELVADYFHWRSADAHRNSLNAYCYWKQRESGKSVKEATDKIKKLSVSEKNELLFGLGINFNDLPAWQKRGIGFYWEWSTRQGYNPVKQTQTEVRRRTLTRNEDLPLQGYREMLLELMKQNEDKG